MCIGKISEDKLGDLDLFTFPQDDTECPTEAAKVIATQGQQRASHTQLGNYFYTKPICLCHISNELLITVPRCNAFIEMLMHQK